MRKNGYKRRWLCGVLALMSGFVLPGAVQANSGGAVTNIGSTSYYVGIKGDSGNEVIIDHDLDVGVIGGYAKSGSGSAEASNNGVTVRGGVVKGNVYGGYADSNAGSTASSNNRVTVNAGNIMGSIYGGDAFTAAGSGNDNNAYYNTVMVSGSKVSGNIYGGYAQSYYGSAKASNNSVTISDSTVDNETKSSRIYGGYAIILSGYEHAEASNNNVTVSGSKVSSDIYGGYAQSSSGSAGTNNNSVMMSGGNIEGSIYGGCAKSYSDYAEASKNSVAISGGMVTGSVYGGRVYSENRKSTDTTAAVKGNRVSISGGTVTGNVYGGHANSVSGSAEAVNNSIMVSGGTITGEIYGSYATSISMSSSAEASNNNVTISGGTVIGEIYGSYVPNGKGSVNNNAIILSGTADVSNADLYGSNLNAEKTGNNLVINGWSGAVKSLNNFDQLEVRAVAGGRNLTAGDRIFLFTVTDGADDSFSQNPEGQKVNAQAGVALTVDGTIEKDGNTLLMDTASVRASDQTVIAVESRAASVAAVGRGAEAVTDSLDTLRESREGLSTFASIIGSRSRYNTGSHADVNGWNGIVGTAWTRELTSGTLSCGAFYENGGGSYDTYNTINGRTYRGDGDTVYNGGGLLLRWETNGGTYTEASLRAGMVKNEVGPSLEFAGNRYGFKTENNYYGGHVGIGRIMERDDGDAWDIYGKYFHMHHEGDTVTIAGDEFAFDSVNSDRLRVGARYLDRKNGRFTGYYGLAYEYEFSGDTGGTANHHAMYTPSLQGSTVIGEIGFRGTPGEDSPWSFEVSLRGYAGKQEGISGAVTAAYSF